MRITRSLFKAPRRRGRILCYERRDGKVGKLRLRIVLAKKDVMIGDKGKEYCKECSAQGYTVLVYKLLTDSSPQEQGLKRATRVPFVFVLQPISRQIINPSKPLYRQNIRDRWIYDPVIIKGRSIVWYMPVPESK